MAHSLNLRWGIHPSAEKLKTRMKKIIKKAIQASKTWSSQQRHITPYHRHEGELGHKRFAKRLLKLYKSKKKAFNPIPPSLVVGFEVEFFLKPALISKLANGIEKRLPKDQVLLIDLNNVPTTDGINFYLIAERTGSPPSGLQSFELVSPKLDPLSLIYYLSEFIRLLVDIGAQDGNDIGMHLHVSTRHSQPISPLAIMHCLHQNHLLHAKSRKFTRDIIKQMFAFHPDHWHDIYSRVLKKNYNINFLDFVNQHHFELRALGGQGYLAQQGRAHPANYALAALNAINQALHISDKTLAKQIRKTYRLKKKMVQLSSLSNYSGLAKKPMNTIWKP